MYYKWIGAILIITGCGSAGAAMAIRIRKEEAYLRQLIDVILFIENELRYKLSPLPEICLRAKEEVSGVLRQIFDGLAKEMMRQTLPDPGSCMSEAIQKCEPIPVSLRRSLLQLGHTLGRFDLEGQLQGLHCVREKCIYELEHIRSRRSIQLRSYQTLGLCAGVALAILFI